MALVTDTWNKITFKPYSNAAWTGLMNPPSIPSPLGKVILAGTGITVYVVTGGSNPVVAFAGGSATFPAGVVDTESLQTGVTVTDDFGQDTKIVRDGAISLWYNVGFQQVTSYGSTATATIHTITT